MNSRKAVWSLLLVGLCTGLVLASDRARTELTDEEITKKLVGKWEEEINEDAAKGKVTLEYKKDGNLAAEGTVDAGGQNIKFKIAATWKVKDKELIVTFDKVEPEGLIPAGTVSRDKILSIDEKSCSYRDQKGSEKKMTRLKD